MNFKKTLWTLTLGVFAIYFGLVIPNRGLSSKSAFPTAGDMIWLESNIKLPTYDSTSLDKAMSLSDLPTGRYRVCSTITHSNIDKAIYQSIFALRIVDKDGVGVGSIIYARRPSRVDLTDDISAGDEIVIGELDGNCTISIHHSDPHTSV